MGFHSSDYWIRRYETGGTSGPGSESRLASFKASIVNTFVERHRVNSVIDFGCGDGNQLRYFNIPRYLGLDVSTKAIEKCIQHFSKDSSKTFKPMYGYNGETAELALSLDVVFHLVEECVFQEYMYRLFDAADRYVMIYSSNTNTQVENQPQHIRHRKFTDWVDEYRKGFSLILFVRNPYPFEKDWKNESFSDFYIYERKY